MFKTMSTFFIALLFSVCVLSACSGTKAIANSKEASPVLQNTQSMYTYYDSSNEEHRFRVMFDRDGDFRGVEYYEEKYSKWIRMKEEPRQPLYCYITDGKCTGKELGNYCCEPITATVDNVPTILKTGNDTTIKVLINGKYYTWEVPD